jgi:hypothetical protein
MKINMKPDSIRNEKRQSLHMQTNYFRVEIYKRLPVAAWFAAFLMIFSFDVHCTLNKILQLLYNIFTNLCSADTSLSYHTTFNIAMNNYRYFSSIRSSKLLYDWKHVLVSSTLVGLATRYYFLSVCCCLKFAVLFLWGALSNERMGPEFEVQSFNGPGRAEPVTILYCLIWDSPNLDGQVPVFISPRNRVAQLYPWVLGSLYVTSCDSQDYGEGIITLLQHGEPGPRMYISLKNRMVLSKVKVKLRRTTSQSACFGV